MKKLFLATTALVALVAFAPADAADLRAPVMKAPPVMAPPCAQFGGGYIGANIGYGYYASHYHDRGNLVQTIDDDLPTHARVTDDRWNGGVQIGYNWQSRCTVFGIEADWSWTNLRAEDTFLDGDGGTQDALSISSRMRWFGTVRARTGVVVDNLLLYVTGGLAYARFNRDYTVFEDAPATTAIFSSSRTRWGWVAGVGTEWAFTNNLSLKSEFLYMRFADDDRSFTGTTFNGVNFGVPGRNYVFGNQDEAWITRIGLNYRFGGAPVLAKY
jgi:outer membrane immunogenic protein